MAYYVLIIQWCLFIVHAIMPSYSSFNYGFLPFNYSISIQYWLTGYTWASKSTADNRWTHDWTHKVSKKWRWVRTELGKEKRINYPMWPFNKKMDKLSTSLNTVEWGGGYFNVAGHIHKNIQSSAATTLTAICCSIYCSRFWHLWKKRNGVAVPVLQTGCNYWHENQFLRTP